MELPIKELGKCAALLGMKRPLLVTDPGLARLPMVRTPIGGGWGQLAPVPQGQGQIRGGARLALVLVDGVLEVVHLGGEAANLLVGCLELGAGCGLCGIVAARHCAASGAEVEGLMSYHGSLSQGGRVGG